MRLVRRCACDSIPPLRRDILLDLASNKSEGFSHFVTSIAAPVASGWSVSPGGTCTHWKAPPCHGAHPKPTPSSRIDGHARDEESARLFTHSDEDH
jgi:hypothetical protein